MAYFAGLDVSVKETSVCIVDDAGKIVREARVASEPEALLHIGIGHGAIDAGVGYTYLNPQTGHEFSGVLGFTYNFTNQSTQYQNGVDMHFDWGASQFLTKQFLSVLYNNQMLRA